MKRHVLWIAAAIALMSADSPKQDTVNADLEKLQGTWQVVIQEREGMKAPEELVEMLRIAYKGDHYTFFLGARVVDEGTIVLDPSKEPRSIDNKPGIGPHKGETIPGIYKLEGDKLSLCYAPAGKERPTEFKTELDSGRWRYVLKRRTP
jgi:uncharacterized protein (TIGR03067 family)